MIGSKPSLWALLLTFVLMTGYSVNLPFLRWKKSTTLTVMIHSIGMTISFNIAAFMHMKTFVLNKATTYPRSLFFATVVMAIFYAVVAMAKDMPDIEGDKAAGIKTLAIRLGSKRVFWFCVSLLEIAYGAAILIGASSPFLWSKIFSVSTHAIMALILWNRAHSVDLSSNISLQSFYMFIFKGLWMLQCDHYMLPDRYNSIVEGYLWDIGFYHVSQIGVVQFTGPTLSSYEALEGECLDQFGIAPRKVDCRKSFIKLAWFRGLKDRLVLVDDIQIQRFRSLAHFRRALDDLQKGQFVWEAYVIGKIDPYIPDTHSADYFTPPYPVYQQY
ncbi:naringenin 8-dimethylallyltransferase 2, chloroplastic-like [Arachis hypogaea]|uniref:naringenin 8-dimethylallyltransferase 2, chloroplastic-like n=1 Tax=Arachis hypogaea TaxID=3818 RepID=UPI003B211D0F